MQLGFMVSTRKSVIPQEKYSAEVIKTSRSRG